MEGPSPSITPLLFDTARPNRLRVPPRPL